MRFPNGFNWEQMLKYSSQRLTRILTVPVTNGCRRLRRFLNPNGFATRVMSDVRTESKKILGGKPQSLADYYSIGNWYVAKKLVFVLAVLMFVLPVLYLKFVHPVIRSNFLTVTMVVNSPEQMGYTGKVKLLDRAGGTVLYHGELAGGRITGEGSLYDHQGNLVYRGTFLQEKYEGQGEAFWPNGEMKYRGGFRNNLYEGQGILYDASGEMVYDGLFQSGQYQGEGVLYQAGQVLYRGSFQAGQMEGEGTLYAGDQVIYEGGFAAGTLEGEGKQYDPVTGSLHYTGGFAAGQYEGEGKLYDAQSGQVRYLGGFGQGTFEGSGVLYELSTGMPVYEGTFHAGRYDGEGILFDREQGAMIYQGQFRLGLYHGAGTEYDPDTGFVTVSGQYRYGEPVVLGLDPGPGTQEPGDQEPPENQDPPGSGFYTGPRTKDGQVDLFALAKLSLEEILALFRQEPERWNLNGGSVLTLEDRTEKIGLAIRVDGKDQIQSLDCWNDMTVAGARVGMTEDQIAAALGAPVRTEGQTMGTQRMISVSQSNRYFGRLTNLSPESRVTQRVYQTQNGLVYGVFSGGQCLVLEVHP